MAELKYTTEHEWIDVDGDIATVGITRYAADALGDVVYVDLPTVGAVVTAGRAVGELESTKTVGELFAPVDGEVVEVNEALATSPELVNAAPFDAGWLIRVRFDALPDDLLDEGGYAAFIAGQAGA
ncbi:MAG: glycine cleavage system protein H [Micrococcales bacterium 73-13]|nr:MAG: glycine cleavage system protein H [Micrococcales bacterium 73-13]